MAEKKLKDDELEKVPVSGGTDTPGDTTRMHDNMGMIEAEMMQATGGLKAAPDTGGPESRATRVARAS